MQTTSSTPQPAFDTPADESVAPSRPSPDQQYAVPGLRDQFLAALDAQDRSLTISIAHELRQCRNPLPGNTCLELGLPPRSTYGRAARHVLGETLPD
jgi:hypothetical protein